VFSKSNYFNIIENNIDEIRKELRSPNMAKQEIFEALTHHHKSISNLVISLNIGEEKEETCLVKF